MASVVEFQMRQREPRRNAAREGAAEIIILPVVRFERLPQEPEFPEPATPQRRVRARAGK